MVDGHGIKRFYHLSLVGMVIDCDLRTVVFSLNNIKQGEATS